MNYVARFAAVLAGTLAATLLIHAQPPPPQDGAAASASTNTIGPRIAFSTERYEFGKFPTGAPIHCTFYATNTGDETLEIEDVHPGCGCTTVDGGWKPTNLAPNQSCLIPISIATTALPHGQLTKTVSVKSNDRNRPFMMLNITGELWSPIEIVPQSAVLNLPAGSSTPISTAVQIKNNTDVALDLSAPTCNTNVFSATLKTNTPGMAFELIITAIPTNMPHRGAGTSFINGTVVMQSSSTNTPELKIPVTVIMQSAVTISPALLTMPMGPLQTPTTRVFNIHANTATPLAVSNPHVSVPDVEATVREVQPGFTFQVMINFPKGFVITPKDRVVVTVDTDNPDFPTIRVPVSPIPGQPQPLRVTVPPPLPDKPADSK